MNNQIVRVGLTLLLSMTMLPALIGQATVAAKDPQSTPAAISHLPSGALGVQIQWLLDTINTPANVATADPIEKHVSPVLLARITAEQLAMDFLKLNAQQGLFTVRPDSIVTSRDVPATIAIFVLVGHAGDQIRTSMTIDRDSGLITALNFQLGTAATPVASPDTHITLPQGALGEQIQWLLGMIGGASPALSHATIAEHFTPGFLAQLPSESLMNVLNQLVAGFGPLQIEDGSLATSRDNPPTSAMLIVQGKNHARFKVSIAVDRDSGLISGLLFQPALAVSPAATAIASPIANGAFVDEEITFQSGSDTIYGSFMHPKPVTSSGSVAPIGAVALIISGSGPTDRNGNSGPLTSMNTNLNIANTLASNGVASLRYDKLGSGKTGIGAHISGEGIDYTLFLQEAQDAASFLLGQPNVDPEKLILVGHSEGALFALVLAQHMVAAGKPPAGLILVSPLSIRYLDLVEEQVSSQFDHAAATGQMTQAQADAGNKDLTAIIESLRTKGTLPTGDMPPALQPLFNPTSVAFLAQIDKIDPREIAKALPATLPVLVLHGEKDQQVTSAQVAHLMSGFELAGNQQATLVELPNTNHLMKVVKGTPNAAIDYANPALPFSSAAITAVDTFLHDIHLAGKNAGT